MFRFLVCLLWSFLLQVTEKEEGDLIAKRTRSQLPLQDVPIESIEGITNANRNCFVSQFSLTD